MRKNYVKIYNRCAIFLLGVTISIFLPKQKIICTYLVVTHYLIISILAGSGLLEVPAQPKLANMVLGDGHLHGHGHGHVYDTASTNPIDRSSSYWSTRIVTAALEAYGALPSTVQAGVSVRWCLPSVSPGTPCPARRRQQPGGCGVTHVGSLPPSIHPPAHSRAPGDPSVDPTPLAPCARTSG